MPLYFLHPQLKKYIKWMNQAISNAGVSDPPRETDEELDEYVDLVFGEADWDDDDFLSLSEFAGTSMAQSSSGTEKHRSARREDL